MGDTSSSMSSSTSDDEEEGCRNDISAKKFLLLHGKEDEEKQPLCEAGFRKSGFQNLRTTLHERKAHYSASRKPAGILSKNSSPESSKTMAERCKGALHGCASILDYLAGVHRAFPTHVKVGKRVVLGVCVVPPSLDHLMLLFNT